MTTLDKHVTSWERPLVYPQTHSYSLRRTLAHRRLNRVFELAHAVRFDDRSRLIFFSDCHRGDKGRTDAFAVNETLFLYALQHYYRSGFTYIEVGDGDELWKNRRFSTVRQAHAQVFDCLHRFDQHKRLHMIFGNHDIVGDARYPVNKDGIQTYEGLKLKHRRTGQQIFVTHGHQADITSDTFYRISRLVVRTVWRKLQLWGLVRVASYDSEKQVAFPFERFLMSWAATYQHTLICGHTHRFSNAAYGEAPYFNTGHCVAPRLLTGLEIQGGEICAVRWRAIPGSAEPFRREVISAPRKLKYI